MSCNMLKKMRAEQRDELFRKVIDDKLIAKGKKVGNVFILPNSYPRSPRNMKRCFEDSIALVGEVGRPNYFITFTKNPKWPEISKYLRKGERCVDQPMSVARVFHCKCNGFLHDIVEHKVLGEAAGYAYNTEIQRLGLPHVPMLLCIKRQHQMLQPEDIDDFIQAHIPRVHDDNNDQARQKWRPNYVRSS